MFAIKNGRKYFSVEIRNAIKNGNIKTVHNLTKGLNLKEIKDHLGVTLLHLSIKIKNNNITKFLIDKGCDVDAQDEKGTTPLLAAVRLFDIPIIQTLLEAKANMFLSDKYGTYSLKLVLYLSINGWIKRIHLIKIFAKYLKKCELNANQLALILLKAAWPIHYAIFIENSEIIRLMLEAGCPVDSYDTDGTALYAAILNNDVKSINILLDYGAKPFEDCGRVCSPFSLALSNAKVLETILDRAHLLKLFKTDRTMTCFNPFINVDQQIVELLLFKYKINLSVKDIGGNSILHYLVLNWNPKVIDLIFKTNFDVNMRNVYGETLLHCMVGHSLMDAIKMLINRGADVNAKNKNGYTPLVIAIIRRAKEQEIDFLLKNGAILDERTQSLILNMVAEEYIPTFIIIPILRSMAVIHFQDSAISRENLNLMKRLFKACDYFEAYLQELYSMKHKLITKKSNISFFDIICASEQRLVNYARNDEIVNNIFKVDVCLNYPNFGESIKTRFEFAKVKKDLIQGTIDSLNENIKQLNCNLNIIENIVKFLSLDDLQRLGMNSRSF